MTPHPRDYLPTAFAAVDIARDLIRTRSPATVTEKSDRDLATDVDLAVERAVREHLGRATRDIQFLGEEEGGPASGNGWLWTLDPIDGTSNYTHGIPLCAASLALIHDGRAVLGVIDAPFLRERYHATDGDGAWLGDQRLTASSTGRLHDAIVAIGDYATGPGAGRKNETQLAATVHLTPRVHRLRMLGTAALDLAWVAAGRLDASVTFSNNPWDTSAGVILAREAGAKVTDTNGDPHTFTSATTIAAAAPLLPQLLALLQTSTRPVSLGTQTDASPYADLDHILSHAQHLIFDFDDVICSPDGMPAGYIEEALTACRDSGRTATVIASQTVEAVTGFLATHGLDELAGHTFSHSGSSSAGSVAQTLTALVKDLSLSPARCACITAATTIIEGARTAGISSVGYATTPSAAQQLADARSDSLVISLADLTLRLRARPLPN